MLPALPPVLFDADRSGVGRASPLWTRRAQAAADPGEKSSEPGALLQLGWGSCVPSQAGVPGTHLLYPTAIWLRARHGCRGGKHRPYPQGFPSPVGEVHTCGRLRGLPGVGDNQRLRPCHLTDGLMLHTFNQGLTLSSICTQSSGPDLPAGGPRLGMKVD